MKKTEKLSLLNNIKSSEETNDSCYSLSFPVHHKNKRNDVNLPLPSQITNLLSVADVEKVICNAYEYAEKIVSRLSLSKILQRHNIKDINQLCRFVSQHLSKTSRTTDSSTLDETVCSDDDSSSYVSDDENLANEDITVDDVDIDQEFESDTMEDAGENVQEISTSKNHFDGMRIHDHVEPSSIHQHFQITINQKKKYIHKQTAAHVLTSNKHYLSSDRLARVQQMSKKQ